jgi:hypothetical protein
MKYENATTQGSTNIIQVFTLFSLNLEQPTEWKTMAATSCACVSSHQPSSASTFQPLCDGGSTSTNTNATTKLLDLALHAAHLFASSHRERSATGPARAWPLRAQLGCLRRRPTPRGPLTNRVRSHEAREN